MLNPSPDFPVRSDRRGERGILFAGLQAAAVEAQRQRSPPNLHSHPKRGLIYSKRWMATGFGKICVGSAAGCSFAP
jgi:hypothetical protein